MNVIGTWKIAEVYTFDEDFNKVLKTVDEVMNDPETDGDTRMTLTADFEFCDDGMLYVKALLPEGISQEEIDEAVAAGEITLCGEGRFILGSHEWKEEDGKLLYNSGIQGEVLGEEVSPWEELEQTEDGKLRLMVYVLEKAV